MNILKAWWWIVIGRRIEQLRVRLMSKWATERGYALARIVHRAGTDYILGADGKTFHRIGKPQKSI